MRLFGLVVTRKIAFEASEALIEPLLKLTAPPASVYAMPPPENLMMIIVGIIEKPTPWAATSVTGVVCNARICALERLTETFGRSCATSERNVGGPADPELGPAHTKLAF